MNLKNRILNFSFKRQKLIEVLAVFFIFSGVSFNFTAKGTKWLWADYPFIAILIAGFSLVLVLIWLKTEKYKILTVINSIRKKSEKSEKIDLLSPRQKQVFDLILQNKTNKQISEALFIELSTLKTHINKIYKTLNIKSRKEVKTFK